MPLCKCCSGRGSSLTAAVALLLTACAGLLLAYPARDAVAGLIRAGVRGYSVLDSTSAGGWPGWLDSRDPSAGQVTSRYYVFNITNVEAVLKGAKPDVQQIGPLVYNYVNTKHNYSWESDSEEIVYHEYQRYLPADDATRALQDAPITTVNILLLAALADATLASLIPVLPYWESPSFWFPQRTPHDILFGYVDPQLFNNAFPGLQPNDTSLEYALGKHSKSRMATGKGDSTRGYEYIEWSGGPTLQCCDKGVQGETGAGENCHGVWQSYDAEAIAGVFGTAFHTAVDPSETLQLATYDFGILRHWPLECANVGNGPGAGSLNDGSSLTAAIGGCDSYVVQDVSLLKFALPTWVLGNASVSPDEAAAYNITGPSGLLDVATCEQSAPIRLSLPFFLHGSTSLRDALTGLDDADEARHGSWLGVEPLTGQVLDFQFRIQINAAVKPVTVNTLFVDHTFYKGMADIAALPIAWGEQLSSANADQGAKFRSLVYTPLRVAAGLHWGGWTLVAVALLGAAVVAARAAGYCGGAAAAAAAAADADGYARAIGDYDDDDLERQKSKKASLLAGDGAELPPRGGRGGLRL